jgi:outer membrane immunogenic protein
LPARTYTKAPAVVASVYSWTGFYVGVEGGGDWGRSQHYENNPASATFGLPQTGGINLSGALAGGTVGYNYQINNIVIGIENDISWTNIKGSANLIPPFVTTQIFQTSQTWLDTLRGRIGYAWDRVLVYGTGGASFTNEKILLCDPIAAGCAGQSRTVTGWTAGVGAEYAFTDNWSVKLEYLHADFGRQAYVATPTPALFANGASFFAPRIVSLTDDIVRVGVNYKFGWGGPVVARY